MGELILGRYMVIPSPWFGDRHWCVFSPGTLPYQRLLTDGRWVPDPIKGDVEADMPLHYFPSREEAELALAAAVLANSGGEV